MSRPAHEVQPQGGAQEVARASAAAMLAADAATRGLGIAIQDVAPGRATARMTVTAAMVNGHGVCHGGYVFLLADSAFAFACNTYGVVTVASGADVTFVAPARAGDQLCAEAVERARWGRSGIYDVTVRRVDPPALVAEFRGRARATSVAIARPDAPQAPGAAGQEADLLAAPAHRVRPLAIEDGMAIAAWPNPGPWSVADALEPPRPDEGFWAVDDAEGRLAGYCCFGEPARPPLLDQDPGALDVALGLRPDLRGTGAAGPFALAVVARAHDVADGRRLRCAVARGNPGGRAAAEAAGFRAVGEHALPGSAGHVVYEQP